MNEAAGCIIAIIVLVFFILPLVLAIIAMTRTSRLQERLDRLEKETRLADRRLERLVDRPTEARPKEGAPPLPPEKKFVEAEIDFKAVLPPPPPPAAKA